MAWGRRGKNRPWNLHQALVPALNALSGSPGARGTECAGLHWVHVLQCILLPGDTGTGNSGRDGEVNGISGMARSKPVKNVIAPIERELAGD